MTGRQLLPLLLCMALPALAQGPKDPGSVTYVQGAVSLKTDGGAFHPVDYDALPMLEAGDAIQTEMGYIEMIPIRGVFLCLGNQGMLEVVARTDAGVTLKLLQGSVMVDALSVKKKAPVTILAGDAKTVISSSGEYRVDYTEESSGLQVKKGKAMLTASGADHSLKKKQWAEVSGDGVSLTKFKDFDDDALTSWRNNRMSYNATVYTSREYFGMGDLPDAARAGIGHQPGTSPRMPAQF